MPQPVDDDALPSSPIQALPTAASGAPARLPKLRNITQPNLGASVPSLPLSNSESSLPYRRANPSAASLYASTLSPPGSRSMSPAGRGSPSRIFSGGGVFDAATDRELAEAASDNPGDPLNLILRAFVPHVTICSSEDTDAMMSDKGFKDGLWELLRPFGERIQGRVSIRDSTGISRPVDDFSIRFTQLGSNIEHPDPAIATQNGSQGGTARDRKVLADVETLVERHLTFAEESYANGPHFGISTRQGLDIDAASPYHALYMRRLLSGIPIAPHETFAHPVCCVVAISSRNETPIEELRRLYEETNSGSRKLPPWVDGEYLRYYVLIHDEENDDITRSMGFFDQMKRHLGPHCHLLRLRSSQSIETDDDSIPLPRSDWMTADEELAEIKRSEDDVDFEDPTRHIFESDATAIRTFIREMVTQSIIPTMERHVSVWNDQVASKRKGLAGTFSSLTKRFPFGSTRSSLGGSSGVKEAYDPAGFYHAQAPDAILRKLADYAFMLRDWKLANSTYELLRAGFANAKAWKYQAAADEMAAVSLLLVPQYTSSKSRYEAVEQIIESAVYSYSTRCMSPYGAVRSMLLPVELLRLRGGANIDGAGRLGVRLLDSKLLGSVGDALLKERLAISYATKEGVGSWNWGNRIRKSGLWSYLAADAWLQQEKFIPSQRCLNQAFETYESLPHGHGMTKFTTATGLLEQLQRTLSEKLDLPHDEDEDGANVDGNGEVVDEESEALTDLRTRRVSLVAGAGGMLETKPLHGAEGPDDTTVGGVQMEFDETER